MIDFQYVQWISVKVFNKREIEDSHNKNIYNIIHYILYTYFAVLLHPLMKQNIFTNLNQIFNNRILKVHFINLEDGNTSIWISFFSSIINIIIIRLLFFIISLNFSRNGILLNDI